MRDRDGYDNPLGSRYASDEMVKAFSDRSKFTNWRKVWLALAESEKEIGLPITTEQISELRATRDDINFDVADERERRVRHDVMAHVYAWGVQAPKAAGILHMGATSAFVTDNADLILMRDGLNLILGRAAAVIRVLASFAREHRALPCLGFTHGQPAQPTTVGKRACLWLLELVMDVRRLENILENLPCRGVKGTVGTQASFLELLEGDSEKVRKLEGLVAKKLGFANAIPITGQTYTRKIDVQVVECLSGIAQSASKFGNDIRLLQKMHEIEEPFGRSQIGSSAMVYKRNPMRSERICSLARHVMTLAQQAAMTASVQWFERTLDDSAGRRLYIPESFLTTDAILVLMENVAGGLVVYPRVIQRDLADELPFMASEAILMTATRAGGNRQELHERMRVHSQAAAREVLERGRKNDFFERIAEDSLFSSVRKMLPKLTDPMQFIGRAPEQVDDFLDEHVDPMLDRLQPKRSDATV